MSRQDKMSKMKMPEASAKDDLFGDSKPSNMSKEVDELKEIISGDSKLQNVIADLPEYSKYEAVRKSSNTKRRDKARESLVNKVQKTLEDQYNIEYSSDIIDLIMFDEFGHPSMLDIKDESRRKLDKYKVPKSKNKTPKQRRSETLKRLEAPIDLEYRKK